MKIVAFWNGLMIALLVPLATWAGDYVGKKFPSDLVLQKNLKEVCRRSGLDVIVKGKHEESPNQWRLYIMISFMSQGKKDYTDYNDIHVTKFDTDRWEIACGLRGLNYRAGIFQE